jgi:hypothetical protein
MTAVTQDHYELRFVARLLNSRRAQILKMCRVLGAAPLISNGELYIYRDTIEKLYEALYPEYIPPEAA